MTYQVLDNGVVRDTTPEEAAEIESRQQAAPIVPQEVSRRQGLQAIFLMYGMTQDQVEAKITSIITDPTQQYLALVEIRASQTFERQRPIVIQMGQALGWDLDALFIKAASLP